MKKIAVIVEGPSDKLFLDTYIKRFVVGDCIVKIFPSKNSPKKGCQILNYPAMAKKIHAFLEAEYKEVFILVDLNTQQCDQQYRCIESLVRDYETGLKKQLDKKYLEKVETLIVVCELEAWMMSAWGASNDYFKDYKHALKKKLGFEKTPNEADMIKRFINQSNQGKISLNPKNNTSFKRFIDKIGASCTS